MPESGREVYGPHTSDRPGPVHCQDRVNQPAGSPHFRDVKGTFSDVRDFLPVSHQADRKHTGSARNQACTHAREILTVADWSRREEVPGREGEGAIGGW